jgi:hypothetical protein
MRFLIEDGLRTASLREHPQALVLVRRVDLGRLRSDSSPAAIARRLEERWSEAEREVVVLRDPVAAATAGNAVGFSSLTSALSMFARMVARGPVPRQWFWDAIVLGEQASIRLAFLDRQSAAEAVLRRTPDAVVEWHRSAATNAVASSLAAISGLLAELAAAGDLERFVELLDPVRLERLLYGFGIAPAASRLPISPAPVTGLASSPPIENPVETLAEPWQELLRRAITRWPVSDPRVWLVAIAAVCVRQPWRASTPTEISRAADRLIRMAAQTVQASTPRVEPGRESSAETSLPGATELQPVRAVLGDEASFATPCSESPWTATRFGGLYFLAATAERLGCPNGAPVLLQLGEWLRMEPQDSALAPLLALDLGEIDQPAALFWTKAVRRYLRRRWRLRWMAVASRPGRIAWTRTHIDVAFDLRDADLRIRRAGLDINPGWIGWLGKVVTFHYGYGAD